MNVILLEKIGKLGSIGDTARVKAGYARNFLFPKGKAIPATRENLEEFERRKAELLAAHNEKVAQAQARADRVQGARIAIEVNAGEEGKLFGSIGTRDICRALNEETGSDISKSEVLMPHGVIREVGEYAISLDLGYDVHADIDVAVVSSGSAAGVSDDGSIMEEIEQAGADEQADAGEPAPHPAETGAGEAE